MGTYQAEYLYAYPKSNNCKENTDLRLIWKPEWTLKSIDEVKLLNKKLDKNKVGNCRIFSIDEFINTYRSVNYNENIALLI